MRPSLALIPSAFNTGKLYSVLPEDGTGDFTVSRNGNASYFDKDGILRTALPNEPRFDHDPVTGEFKGILVEPAATNLLLRSEEFDNTQGWTILSSRFTFNKVLAPDGTNNAFEFVEVIQTDAHNIFSSAQNRPISIAGTTYTFSCFFRQGTRRYAGIGVGSGGSGVHLFLDTLNWQITSSKRFGSNTNWEFISNSLQNFGNGWYKVSLTFRTVTSITLIPSIFASNSVTSNFLEPSYLGDGSTIIVYGAQLEVGPVATSYIQTTGSQVTRPADNIRRNNAQDLIGQTEGSIYMEVSIINGKGAGLRLINIGTDNSNRIDINKAFQNNNIHFRIGVNNVFTLLNVVTPNPLDGRVSKMLFRYGSNTQTVFIDGIKLNSITYPGLPFLRDVVLGQLNDHIKSAAVFKIALSDEQAIARTTL